MTNAGKHNLLADMNKTQGHTIWFVIDHVSGVNQLLAALKEQAAFWSKEKEKKNSTLS